MTDRLIVLLDMDCFYVQVEERHHPHIKGIPAAVVQYNTWKGGGIIAVNYEARAFGVKRGMRGDEARSKCPDIHLVQVPVNRGKADLTRYRDAGKEVINVLCDFGDCVERASIDEAYIDFTNAVQEQMKKLSHVKISSEKLKSTWVVGHDEIETENATVEDKEEIRRNGLHDWLSSLYEDDGETLSVTSNHPSWHNIRLAHTAVLCEEMRASVLERTGFKCSAGITHNKMLSKLACGLHKPNQQTILPHCKVEALWQTMPVFKVRNLGGKLGDSLTEELGCNTMGDLRSLSLQQLMGRYDNKTAHWLHNLGQGIDTEQVTSRQLPKSIGCGKNFQGKEALNTREKVQKWMLSLAEELSERLDLDQTSNKRRAKTLTVSVRVEGDNRFTSMSRSSNLPSYCAEQITRVALSLIQHTNQRPSKDPSWSPTIKNISLSAGKFEDWTSAGSGSIQEMFKKARQNPKNNSVVSDSEICKNIAPKIGVVMDAPLGDQQLNGTEPKTSDEPKSSDVGQKTKLTKCETSASIQEMFKKVTQNPKNNSVESNSEIQESVAPKLGDQQLNITQPKTSSDGQKTELSSYGQKTELTKCEKTSPKNTNSFFRSILQKRENRETEAVDPVCNNKTNEPDVEIFEQVTNASENGADSDDESVANNDLDLLVSYLSDEETSNGGNDIIGNRNNISEEESDDSLYDASTDIDSSISSEHGRMMQQHQSQDLFAEDNLDELAMANNSQDCANDKVMDVTCDSPQMQTPTKQITSRNNPGPSSVMCNETENVTADKIGLMKTNVAFESRQKIRETEEIPKVSVDELFPDLDNFDESLLSFLPKELKLEVEKALKVHKTKTLQRKSGLWKYVTSNPSPLKDLCNVSKKISVSSDASDGTDDVQAGPSTDKKYGELSFSSDMNVAIPHSSTNNETVSCNVERNSSQNMEDKCSSKVVDSTSNCELDTKDIIECDECGLKISAFEMPEHADYHVALSLQTDMRKETSPCNRKIVEKHIVKNGKNNRGKKRGKVNVKTSIKDNKIQKLDSFFRL